MQSATDRSSEFKALLGVRFKSDGLDEPDRAHLKRWIENHVSGDDPMWGRIAADARARGVWPRRAIYRTIIRYALAARRIAEAVTLGEDPILREKRQQRVELLALAEKADDLASYYQAAEHYSGIAMFFQRFLKPVEQLRELHQQEARLLRRRAGKEPEPTTFISRQSGGKNRRAHSRKYKAFMSLMADHMREGCGKPHHNAVAMMTNIAFPRAKVTADDSSSAQKATTRSGRLRKAGTLKRKKGA